MNHDLESLIETSDVTFNDIGGMNELKEEIKLNIIYPFKIKNYLYNMVKSRWWNSTIWSSRLWKNLYCKSNSKRMWSNIFKFIYC